MPERAVTPHVADRQSCSPNQSSLLLEAGPGIRDQFTYRSEEVLFKATIRLDTSVHNGRIFKDVGSSARDEHLAGNFRCGGTPCTAGVPDRHLDGLS